MYGTIVKAAAARLEGGPGTWFATLLVLSFFANVPPVMWLASTLFFPFVILLVSQTILVYSLAMLPCYVGLMRSPISWPHIITGLVLTSSLVFLPHIISKTAIDWSYSSFKNSEFSQPPSLTPKSVSLIGGYIPSRTFRGVKRTQCSDLCQDILFKTQIKSVFRSNERGNRTGLFTLAKKPYCPETATFLQRKYRERAQADGLCLIETMPYTVFPDVVIHTFSIIQKRPYRHKRHRRTSRRDTRLALWIKGNQILQTSVQEKAGDSYREVERRFGFDARIAPLPFYFGDLIRTDVPTIATQWYNYKPFAARSILRKRYGLKL